jgi:hypothetical protein
MTNTQRAQASEALAAIVTEETALQVVRTLRWAHPRQDLRMRADRALELYFAGLWDDRRLRFEARVIQVLSRKPA